MSGVNFIGVGCSNVVDAINNISKGLAQAINYRIPISTGYSSLMDGGRDAPWRVSTVYGYQIGISGFPC